MSEDNPDYETMAWLFASTDQHLEGIAYFTKKQDDLGFVYTAELFSDAGCWIDALPRYERVLDAYSEKEPSGLVALAELRIAVGLAAINELERARAAASRAAALVEPLGDPVLILEEQVAFLIVNDVIDASVPPTLVKAIEEIEVSSAWPAAMMWQNLADFCRRKRASVEADSLQLRSWSLRSNLGSSIDEVNRLADELRGSKGEKETWETRHFARIWAILADPGSSVQVRAVSLKRYLSMCSRNRPSLVRAEEIEKDVDWIVNHAGPWIESRFVVKSEILVALVHIAARDWSKALALMRQQIAFENSYLLEVLSGKTLDAFLSAVAKLEGTTDLMMAILAGADGLDPIHITDVFTALSTRRFLAQHIETLRHDHWIAHRTDETSELVKQWTRVRRDIAEQAYHHLVGSHGSVQMIQFDTWGKEMLAGLPKRQKRDFMEALMFMLKASNNAKVFDQRNQIEDSLRAAFPPLDLRSSIEAVNVSELRLRLKVGQILVEYVKVRAIGCPLFANAEDVYCAFVIERSRPLRLVAIGPARNVDREIEAFRALSGVDSSRRSPIRWLFPNEPDPESGEIIPSGDLFPVLLDPILALSPAARSLLLIPDGHINSVPFEALAVPGEAFALDKYEIAYLGSVRDLLLAPLRRAEPTEPVVITAPDFDLSATAEVAKEVTGFTDRGGGHVSLFFRPLPGSETEGAIVAELLEGRLIEGPSATVAAVRELSSPSVLHIATHGFYFPPAPPREVQEADEQQDPLANLSTGFEDPLLRSGIALAGANSWLVGRRLPEEAGTGFLTAQELAEMDLRGTALVVLSACDTGLGDVTIGQGLVGLRFAVAVAGAKWLIVSLWPVPDAATSFLMSHFYAHWDRVSAPHAALRVAQLATRQLFPTTRSWAGFVCFGSDLITESPKLPSGIEALRKTAHVPFDELLEDAQMSWFPPQGYTLKEFDDRKDRLYSMALVSSGGCVEIRYSIVPMEGAHAGSFTESDFQHLLRVFAPETMVPMTPFPREGVRSEFGAHVGYSASVTGLDGRTFAAINFVQHEAYGSAIIWYLFDSMKEVLDVWNREFNSLLFRGELE